MWPEIEDTPVQKFPEIRIIPGCFGLVTDVNERVKQNSNHEKNRLKITGITGLQRFSGSLGGRPSLESQNDGL
jgi:hypothetical protein